MEYETIFLDKFYFYLSLYLSLILMILLNHLLNTFFLYFMILLYYITDLFKYVNFFIGHILWNVNFLQIILNPFSYCL
jgi:hypothetical protein